MILLLKLAQEDLYELTDTKLDADVIIDAIAELKRRDVSPPRVDLELGRLDDAKLSLLPTKVKQAKA